MTCPGCGTTLADGTVLWHPPSRPPHPGWGGARAGAGRPVEEPTVRMRVPARLVAEVRRLCEATPPPAPVPAPEAVAPAVAQPRAPEAPKRSGRGGKRAGAGRKPGDGPIVLVRFPRELMARLDARCEAGETRAGALARLLAG